MASLLVFIALLLLRLCTVQAVVLTLRPAVSPIYPVDLHQVRLRDHVRHVRIFKHVVGGEVNISMSYDVVFEHIGMYFTKLELGSPSREFEVLFDTGSELSWVACSSCAECPRSSGLRIPMNFYDISSSPTAGLVSCSHHKCTGLGAKCSKSNHCNYHVRYGDGDEVDGYYVSDLIHFDMLTSQFNSSEFIVFGCTDNLSGKLTHNNLAFSGIVGFGPGELSIISQLSSRALTPKVFSHCLRGDRGAGGVLALGKVIEPRMIYTPLIQSTHYNVELESISVNGKVLPVDRKTFQDAVVDSGTTLAYLPEVALTAFITAVNIAIPKTVTTGIGAGRQIYEVPSFISMADAFPPVSLNFPGGVSMLLKPQEYLLNTSFFVNIILKDKIIEYDLARQRLGWATRDCSLPMDVKVSFGKNEGSNLLRNGFTNLLVGVLENGVTTWEIAFQKSWGLVTIFGDIILKDKIIEYDLARQRLGWATRDCSLPMDVNVSFGKNEGSNLLRNGFTNLLVGVLENGVTTWEIAFQKSRGPVTIFGDIILKDKIIEYDLARQRLGCATRDCSLPMDVNVSFGKNEGSNLLRNGFTNLLVGVLEV